MNKERIVAVFRIPARRFSVDIDIPLAITANDLVLALNSAYGLGIDTSDVKNCFLKAESPIALLRGNKTLAEYGLRDGTIILFTE